jgi:hypothetical protein
MDRLTIFAFVTAVAVTGPADAAPAEPAAPGRLAGVTDVFAPRPRTPDYELHMASYRGEALQARLLIRRHGDWIRVERQESDRSRIQQIHAPTGVIIDRYGSPAADIGGLSIRAPESAPTPGIDYASRKTGRTWKVAGQRCQIWEVYRGLDRGYTTFTRLGCVTRDGIELARWTTGRTGDLLGERMTGFYLIRRRMAQVDVGPPGPMLDVAAWLSGTTGSGSDASNAYEVVLKAEGSPNAMTIRRSGGSTFTETVNADGARDMFIDRGDGVTVSARIGPTGAPESYTIRRQPRPDAPREVRLPEPARTVFGQSCDWIDVMPDVADAGRHECRTGDGVILAIRKLSRGGDTQLVATSVSRRALATAELLPPAWLLDLKRWGVTD